MGLTVTFNMAEWMQSTSNYGAPSGVNKQHFLFEAELISLLEGRIPDFNLDELEKITIKQLHPTEQAPEPNRRNRKLLRKLIGTPRACCPCCGCTISQEKYQRLKEKFSKYPGLFAE